MDQAVFHLNVALALVLTVIFQQSYEAHSTEPNEPGSTNSVPSTVPTPSRDQHLPTPGAASPQSSSDADIASKPKTANTDSPPEGLRLFMPDGQLTSHSARVYVNHDVFSNQQPELRLLRSHSLTKAGTNEGKSLKPAFVASGQQFTEVVDGVPISRLGTLMVFDLSQMETGFRAMVRVTPVVTWVEKVVTHTVIGPREVNVGCIVAAISWTVCVIGLALLFVIILSSRTGNPLLLLTGADGHLSLAQTQIAAWTLAVASITLMYGFIRLEVPEIPASLVVLMGASLSTGGVAYFQDAQKQRASGGQTPKVTPSLGDLVRLYIAGEDKAELSLAKAQMLFWTIVMLVLFISKSILDGQIWDVPWALVALMGFSQAGYLAPKLVTQP